MWSIGYTSRIINIHSSVFFCRNTESDGTITDTIIYSSSKEDTVISSSCESGLSNPQNEIPPSLSSPQSGVSSSETAPSNEIEALNGDSRQISPAKKKRIHQVFEHVRTFEFKEDAISFIANEKSWSFFYKTKSNEGVRCKYRCNKVKFRSERQCSASLYIVYDSRSSDVKLFKSTSEHDHDGNTNMVFEMANETKIAIREMFGMGVCKPKMILNNLLTKKMDIPDRKKFDTFLRALRAERDGDTTINMNTLKEWLEENSAVPIDRTKPFIVDYEISFDEANPYFRFFVSSKQLMSTAIDSDKVHTDATYKLIWQGYPVLQIGTTDMFKSFHSFGVAVCTSEQSDDFR